MLQLEHIRLGLWLLYLMTLRFVVVDVSSSQLPLLVSSSLQVPEWPSFPFLNFWILSVVLTS